MFNFKYTYRATLTAFAGVTLAALTSVSAFAQSTILVVDTAKVYNDSSVGQHVTRQLKTMAETTGTQLKAKADPLQSRGKTIEVAVDGKSQQQVLADAALKSQILTYQKDTQALQQEMAIAQRELQMTEGKARQLVNAKIKSIIDQIAKERNADVVLERQLVIYGEPADITTTVLARLNSQMTTVPVTRERLPRG
ncbi:hypothetical protein GCM10007853_12960 [Algimonas ampicilliniresistens]|uniref:OmpH family outer membrane protein n=1 Tax=Algimonas ampicilliniresistens TaxID=1298735 RepID=A0ABQ5VAR0_9PROT|nr:OmpH family outer membrane protein [Algimonas ampicilliniresistens]GLQ23422.1 hypothetical protein GCM10007853_12960 [Algimonas ampicilliniresistens]